MSQDAPPRLDGNLAVSRGLGDFEYKQEEGRPVAEQKVSCVPDIYEVVGLKAGSLVILCCDGVWDVMTGDEAAHCDLCVRISGRQIWLSFWHIEGSALGSASAG